LIAAIALLGAVNTAYLTINRFTNTVTACPTSGCEQVLTSPYATVFGLPLALYGLLAYLAMLVFAVVPLVVKPEQNKQLRSNLENWTWLLLFAGATAMLVFSGYLMNIMFSQFVAKFGANGICYYCIASAFFALSLFVLTLLGRSWDDVGQLLFTGIIVAIVTLVGTLGIYAPITSQAPGGKASSQVGIEIKNESGAAEIALAKHLNQTGAKMYGAYWCSHCQDQKELFGQQAAKLIPYIECAPDGTDSKTAICQSAGIEGFPTWEAKGQKVSGTQSLQDLANLSGYTGPREFRNRG
jgi:uncharacterized membrane protein